MRKAWAFALWSPISRERQKTKNDSQCESFLLRSLSPTELIRCSRITSDEENVNKLLCDVRHRAQKSITGPERRKERETFCVRFGKWTRFLRWRTQLHKTTRNASRFSIYIALLDVLESRVMKRTSISYCAMRDFECGYSGSKTLQCEVLGLWWQSQPNFCNSVLLKIFWSL